MAGKSPIPTMAGERERLNSPSSFLPLDAGLLPDVQRVEAHLLDLLSDAGMALVVGFFSDTGDNWQMIATCREGMRGRGLAEIN
jgi:hypothetical protein